MYKRVKVYRNLTKKCWSVASLHQPDYGLVVGYETKMMLRNCNFRVSEASRQRVLRDKMKNVHAWITGYGVDIDSLEYDPKELKPAYYNPYLVDSFVNFDTKESISFSKLVIFDEDFRLFYL
jgi:hypothetical protein